MNVSLFTQSLEKATLNVGQSGLHPNGLALWLVRGRNAEQNKVGPEVKETSCKTLICL